jgi:hypothetical protein
MISTVSVGRAVSPIGVISSVGLEEVDRIDGWSAAFLIGTSNEVTNEAHVQLGLKVPKDVAGWNQVLERTVAERCCPAPR